MTEIREATDRQFLLEALGEAALGRGRCAPNPAVGAVLAVDGVVVARGHHRGPSTAHAEVAALAQATDEQCERGTLYVTLEPCNHFGRTPPCTESILRRKIRRVVYGHPDRNASVAGGGASRLRGAGVDVTDLPLEQVAAFYRSWDRWLATGLASVTAKLALSPDGRYAGPNSTPAVITGPVAKAWTFRWRAFCDAVVTSAATVLADDPSLDARDETPPKKRPLYIFDRQGRLSATCRAFAASESTTIFVGPGAAARAQALHEPAGRAVVVLSEAEGRLALPEALRRMAGDGRQDVFLEAGATLVRDFLSRDRLEQLVLYLGNRALGEGLSAFPGSEPVPTDLRDQFAHASTVALGEDSAALFHRDTHWVGPKP